MFFGRRELVGCDIGSYAVKVVELKEKKDGYHLLAVGKEVLSPEVIVDGAIMDSSMVVEAVRKLIGEKRIKNSNFAISVSGHSVIIKKIAVKVNSPQDLDEAIRWEAEQFIPFDISEVKLDYIPLVPEGAEPVGDVDVLLIAVKQDKITDYVSVVARAGKQVSVVDIDCFAVQNCYEYNYGIDPMKVIALVNIGASVTNVNIISRGETVFWRDISVGGRMFTEALQREFNMTYEQAEALKLGENVGGRTIKDAKRVFSKVGNDLANELKKTFDFFATTTGEGPIDEIVLSGGGALTPELPDVLGKKLGAQVSVMNPFRNVYVKEGSESEEVTREAPSFAVAVGLALRKGGE